jgi:hypothetical protein
MSSGKHEARDSPWATFAEISISELSKIVSRTEMGSVLYMRSGIQASNCKEVPWAGTEVDSGWALFHLKTNPSPWSDSSSLWITGKAYKEAWSAVAAATLGVKSLGSSGWEVNFLPFFSALAPLALPFPLFFRALEGLAALPMSLNGLMEGAISETWPVGIRSGTSVIVLVVAGGAIKRTVDSTRTS